MAKFAVGEDHLGVFRYRAKLKSPYRASQTYNDINLVLMNDKEWEASLEETQCHDKAGLGRFNLVHHIQGDGEWSDWKVSRVRMVRRTQVWYLMASDCNGNAHSKYPDMPKIVIEIEALNDDSHFSQEDTHILPLGVLMMCVFIFLLGRSAWNFYQDIKKGETAESPLALLCFCILCEITTLLMENTNNLIFSYDGEGFWLIKLLTMGWRQASQFLLISLVLLIASGWTLTYKDLFERDHYLLIGIVVLVANGGVAFLGYLDHGEHHKFHDYSGWPGIFLILIRFGIYTLFILRANDTERLMPKRHT